jgi:hypothetical protein
VIDLPAHWRRLTERGFDLPVAIFDLDGVLSDASHRQHHLAADPPDWDGFGRDSHLDDPLADGTGHLERLRTDHHITVVTARPAAMAEGTAAWFARHDIRVDLTVFRRDHDRRPSQDVKRDELNRIRAMGGEVRVVYEDDPENVAMYESAGLQVVYLHSGYYEQGKAAP